MNASPGKSSTNRPTRKNSFIHHKMAKKTRNINNEQTVLRGAEKISPLDFLAVFPAIAPNLTSKFNKKYFADPIRTIRYYHRRLIS